MDCHETSITFTSNGDLSDDGIDALADYLLMLVRDTADDATDAQIVPFRIRPQDPCRDTRAETEAAL
jgi:hypothetical protein